MSGISITGSKLENKTAERRMNPSTPKSVENVLEHVLVENLKS